MVFKKAFFRKSRKLKKKSDIFEDNFLRIQVIVNRIQMQINQKRDDWGF